MTLEPGDILMTGTPVVIPDVRTHPDWSLPTDLLAEVSWMGVPLFARAVVAGLFSLSKREAGYFNMEHMKLAEALSSQASVAVENAILFEQMQASAVRMRSLARRLVEAQESERRHIARELHDEAGQALVSLRFGLRLLERQVDEGGKVNERVAAWARFRLGNELHEYCRLQLQGGNLVGATVPGVLVMVAEERAVKVGSGVACQIPATAAWASTCAERKEF